MSVRITYLPAAWSSVTGITYCAIKVGRASRAAPLRTLLVFGCLARAPSKECCLCLLTMFGLAEFTLRLFGRLGDEACNIFYALPPHTIAAVYSRPINATTGHLASPTQR